MRRLFKLGLVASGVGAVVYWQLQRWFTAEPKFEVERRVHGVEIRRYPSLVRAETVIEGDHPEVAVNQAFRRLAGYIFGANATRTKIAMTAPVTQSSERLAMTTPVTQSSDGAGRWVVTFTMPAGRTLADLPAPRDPRVTLRKLPERRIAALRYSGNTKPERVREKELVLRAALAREGLAPRGEVVSARYDPPSTLPMLRRNEVWLELEPSS